MSNLTDRGHACTVVPKNSWHQTAHFRCDCGTWFKAYPNPAEPEVMESPGWEAHVRVEHAVLDSEANALDQQIEEDEVPRCVNGCGMPLSFELDATNLAGLRGCCIDCAADLGYVVWVPVEYPGDDQ